jgi:uncharacterized protein
MQIQQRDNENEGEFYVEENGEQLAEMTYRHTDKGVITIDHTFVDGKLEGKGVGKQLLTAAVNYAREKGLKIVAVCPFAKAVLEKGKEQYADVTA